MRGAAAGAPAREDGSPDRGRDFPAESLIVRRMVLTKLLRRTRRQDGQTMAEYSVCLAVVSTLTLAALQLFGGNVSKLIARVAAAVNF
jgi:Flp pilus assembly pilin Flp